MPVKKIAKSKTKTVRKTSVKALPAIERTTAGGLSIPVYSVKGLKSGTMTLPKEIFGVNVNEKLLAQAVRVYLSNQRLGTASTKTRGEVRGSSRKIYRQKGTGRARHGSIRAPIFVKGGLAFGPRPRDFELSLPKKMKKAALFSALSAKLKIGEVKVVQGFEKIEPKTKIVADSLKKLKNGKKKTLLVTAGEAKNLYRAGRNIEGVQVLSANMLNAYSVLNNRSIIFMKESIETLKESFLKKEDNE